MNTPLTRSTSTWLKFFSLTALTLGLTAAYAQTTDQEGLIRDKQGKTLYTFDKDKASGASVCYDDCAVKWPAFIAKPEAKASGNLTLHERKDGTRQWGWQGQPLYYFAADAKPGDALGDGAGGVWHTVKSPAAAPQTSQRSDY